MTLQKSLKKKCNEKSSNIIKCHQNFHQVMSSFNRAFSVQGLTQESPGPFNGSVLELVITFEIYRNTIEKDKEI